MEINIWRPIEFSEKWELAITSKLDTLAPSWFRKRESLKDDSKEYNDFINRLKRQHAIETGIVEKLYDLKDGITQTFIKEGFVESYLQHGDTNIPPKQLLAYLKDHFEALDFVFDVVKQNRPISKSFICELHQLVTQNQDTTDAVDTLGRVVAVRLLKGEFKKFENNPKREDGSIFIYCPPLQVDSEIARLLDIYSDLEDREIKPIVIAAWLHHSFTQIHPFQDGNGRLARLLASLILIKHNLFPFTVKGNDKPRYIDALELADSGEPQSLVDFFCEVEKRYIEEALNQNLEFSVAKTSFTEIADIFSGKLETWKNNIQKERQQRITKNLFKIFEYANQTLNESLETLEKRLHGNAELKMGSSYPDNQETSHYYSQQIVEYAKTHDYFYNRNFSRGWFRFVIKLNESRQYQLITTIHHYGYDDATVAIGAFLEFIEPDGTGGRGKRAIIRKGKDDNQITSLPLEIAPLTISLESESPYIENEIKQFLHDSISLMLAQIASEI